MSPNRIDDAAESAPSATGPSDPKALDRLLVRLRPRLHRYCARMIGSVIDAEDIVQEASIKAIETLLGPTAIRTIGRAGRPISFCWAGRTAMSQPFAISAMPPM